MVSAGLPLISATVRVVDSTGKVVASGKPVAAQTGAYGPITLTGTGTYRVEACGNVTDRAMCLWGLSNNGGILNLTPMSSAIAMLASGQSPETLMNGTLTPLTDAVLDSAHFQLRTALAPALTDAGLAGDTDLLTSTLKPGTRTGFDRVLDTVAVGLGADTKPFVTLTTRLGSGTAYLEPGTTQGSMSFDPALISLSLPGVDLLYTKLAMAMANVAACQSAQGGLATLMDPAARASVDPVSTAFTGASQAAQVLCLRLNGVLGDGEVLFGGRLLPTTLGRCSTPGNDPSNTVCRVDFIYLNSKGFQRRLGVEQLAYRQGPLDWTFLGNRLEVQATAAARVVLTRRIDSAAPDSYARYLDVSIPAVGVSGGSVLQCARVSQKDRSGADVPLALFKKAGNGDYLSLWSSSISDATPSLDPFSGATRGNSIVGVPVPAGATGDTTARNFVRAGRALKIELFGDSVCATPLGGLDGDAINIDVAGLLPIAAVGHSGQPWPALSAASVSALAGLKGAINAKVSFGPIWTFPRGGLAVNRATLCTDTVCSSKLSELELAAGATSAALNATLGNTALNASDYKLLRITGRMPDGLVLQLDSQSCSAQTPGLPC